MATKKISELTPAVSLDGTELLELSQLAGPSYNSVNASAAMVAYAASKFGAFYDNTDQTGSTSAATAVKFGSSDISTHGITVVTDGTALTRVTFAEAGTYMLAPSLQLSNSDTANHNVTIWFSKNGTDIVNSATVVNVPKAADGGNTFFQIVYFVTVTAGQYVQLKWLPTHAGVILDTIASGGIPPQAPSAIMVAQRISL